MSQTSLEFLFRIGPPFVFAGVGEADRDEWVPAAAYVLVVESAEELLADEPDGLAAFLQTVDAAAAWWSKPVSENGRFDRGPVPFHVLLNLSASNESPMAETRIDRAAREVGVVLRHS